jgi:hypothetical protein
MSSIVFRKRDVLPALSSYLERELDQGSARQYDPNASGRSFVSSGRSTSGDIAPQNDCSDRVQINLSILKYLANTLRDLNCSNLFPNGGLNDWRKMAPDLSTSQIKEHDSVELLII